jgi:hypothetical protein
MSRRNNPAPAHYTTDCSLGHGPAQQPLDLVLFFRCGPTIPAVLDYPARETRGERSQARTFALCTYLPLTFCSAVVRAVRIGLHVVIDLNPSSFSRTLELHTNDIQFRVAVPLWLGETELRHKGRKLLEDGVALSLRFE